jgi:hypothetical protein
MLLKVLLKQNHLLLYGVLCRAVQGALAQHETYAKLEAQGAQQVELEMRRLRLQVNFSQRFTHCNCETLEVLSSC